MGKARFSLGNDAHKGAASKGFRIYPDSASLDQPNHLENGDNRPGFTLQRKSNYISDADFRQACKSAEENMRRWSSALRYTQKLAKELAS